MDLLDLLLESAEQLSDKDVEELAAEGYQIPQLPNFEPIKLV